MACTFSKRGHSWGDPSKEAITLAQRCKIPVDPTLRVCRKCGATGRVNFQGVVQAVEGEGVGPP